MKLLVGFWVFSIALNITCLAQVDSSFVYKTDTPYGTLDIRLARSASRYYYLQENITVSYRESAPGVKTNSFRDMTSWDSSPYTQGNLREKNGIADYFVMNYRLLYPNNYNASYTQGYPLIVMMHGAGERGNCWVNSCHHADRSWSPHNNTPPAPTTVDHKLLNNDHNLLHGGKVHLDARNLAGTRLPDDPALPLRSFPGFVLYPQNLNGWTGTTVQEAIRLIRLVIKKYNIDENRVYIHGLSNGGSAVYEAIKRAPWLFAAALPMSSVSDGGVIAQGQAPNVAHIPFWIFQGGLDTDPSPGKTQGYIKNLREAGANVRYTLYPQLGHGTWNTAYKEPDFFRWMLGKNKSNLHVFADNPAICLTNGQGVRLALAAGFFKYEWQRNGVVIAGANSATYVANTPGVYRARFSRVPNPTEAQWNQWSDPVTVTEQNPAQAQIKQVGTLLLRDLNNVADARLQAVGDFAHYYWYKNGVLVDLPGTQDDTIQYPVFKQGDCTGACTGNGAYTLVTAGYDNCPSPVSAPKHIFFNNQAPLNILAPTNFTGQVLSPSTVKLTWTDVSNNEHGFEIWSRKRTGTSTYSKWEMRVLTAANTTVYTDVQLDPSTTYQYKIRGVSDTGRSDYTPAASNQFLTITTTADTVNPSTPQNLTASITAINTVTLSWQPSTDNTGIRQYRVYYGSSSVVTSSSQATFKIADLTVNTNYNFTVKAEDLGGNLSAASNMASASTYMTGLFYEHSTGSWSDLDAIDWNIAEFSGTIANFSLSPRTQEDYFNFKFDGYLYITTGGTYQFRTTSSDGSRVTLDSVVVVENDGVHDNRTVTGPLVTLTSGPKRITVKYFEYADIQSLTIRYKGPDTGGSWINIPAEALRSDAGMLLAAASSAREETALADDLQTAENVMNLAVYPNPSSSENIHVRVESSIDIPLHIRLMDFSGRVVYEANYFSNALQEGARIAPAQTLPDGLYLMLIRQGDNIIKKTIAIKN